MTEESIRSAFEDVAFTTAVPFTADASAVDRDALASNLAGLCDAGASLFVACGNTGEYYSLTDAERRAVVETHVESTGPGATVVGGAAGSVAEVVDLADAYAAAGADAVMVMHPDHTYVSGPGVRAYYERICDAVDLPVVVYKRGPEIPRDVLVDLTEREEVVAVKFAVDDVEEFSGTVADAAGSVTWVNGIAERYALSFAVEGATGYTTGVGNFVPAVTLDLFNAVEAGEWERARSIRRLLRPFEDLREETAGDVDGAGNNVPLVKYGMDLVGYVGGPVRPPLSGLTAADETRVEESLARLDDHRRDGA